MLFGAAIVLPLLLAALLPMIQISAPTLGLAPVALLLVIAFPFVTLLGACQILDRNFLRARVDARDNRTSALAALAPPAAGGAVLLASAFGALPSPIGLPVTMAVCVSAAAALSGLLLYRRVRRGEGGAAALEAELPDLLHAVGSKMSAGRSAEYALLDAVEGSGQSPLKQRLRRILFDVVVGRRSLDQAVAREAEGLSSSRLFPALRLLASAAGRDANHAGRVVLHLSEFERLRADAAASMRSKVRAVAETIRTTVVVFAPLILGITAGMYGLLGRIGTGLTGSASSAASSSDPGLFAAVVALYLAVEVLLAGWFAARLVSQRPTTDFAIGLARDVPIALGLFVGSLVGSGALF